MATLDTTGVIAVKFDVDTVQTLGGKTFTHYAGDVVCIPQGTTEITIDAAINVACMTGLVRGVIPGFTMDEIRTSA